MKDTNPLRIILRNTLLVCIGFFVFVVALCGAVFYSEHADSTTRVVFLDVGQGDAILVSEGRYQILIDGGPDGRILLEEIGKYMPFWDRTVEVVIATHPDSDHIDGLVDLVQTYNVEQFWSTQIERDTSVFAALERNLRNRDIPVSHPERGWQIDLPSGAALEIVYPFVASDATSFSREPNNASITALLRVPTPRMEIPESRRVGLSHARDDIVGGADVVQGSEEVFFFGGDLHREIEDLLPVADDITVLKAGHHGSGTSTSQEFLEKTTPRDVIISAGRGNRHGHPKESVIQIIQNFGAKIYRTDKDGSIEYVCNEVCIVD